MYQFRIVVVTPVYEDLEASSRLFHELAAQFQNEIYVVAVDDGSVMHPLKISIMENAGLNGVILKLRRNVGHQRAIAIGLSYLTEYVQPHHHVVVMDSDGEDLPSAIPELLRELNAAEVDVVVAQRKRRLESLSFKAFYFFYKLLFNLMTGRHISFGNFMALKVPALQRLVAMQELSIHVASAVLASKLRTSFCPLDRGPRYAGHSKMNFVSLALHGFRAIMVFTQDVLVRVGIACAFIGTLTLFGAALAVILKLMGFSTPGWFSITLGILFLMLLQTGALALITLMLTGIMRAATDATLPSYFEFVDKIIKTSKKYKPFE
jgi:GT2 family glycosyltransferase